MKKKFYIFLDIDGVLNDLTFIKENLDKKNCSIIKIFNPKSVDALNYLLNALTTCYEVNLVISSSWRINMDETILALKTNKVLLDKISISSTGFISPEKRGLEILEYLNDKQDSNNYVIIDDEYFDFKEYFPSQKSSKPTFITTH